MSTASTGNEPKLDRAALAALYEETFRNLEEGTITEGRVVALTKDKVVVEPGDFEIMTGNSSVALQSTTLTVTP